MIDEVAPMISPHMWRYFDRMLHGYTMIDIAHLRRSGLSWSDAASYVGIEQNVLESMVDMRWVAAGDIGLPEPLDRALADDASLRALHLVKYVVARDSWLFSLLDGV